MTIAPQGAGTALYYTREELDAFLPSPGFNGSDPTLRLICSALAGARRPVPFPMEIRSFSSRHGVLFLVLPATVRPFSGRFVNNS